MMKKKMNLQFITIFKNDKKTTLKIQNNNQNNTTTMMQYKCDVCCQNVDNKSHWKSRYNTATSCLRCTREKDLELPRIVKLLTKIKQNYYEYSLFKGEIMERDSHCLDLLRYLTKTGSSLADESLKSRVCYIEIETSLKTLEEIRVWNLIQMNNILETEGYVMQYEIERLKQYFANNMSLFCDVSHHEFEDEFKESMNAMNNMAI